MPRDSSAPATIRPADLCHPRLHPTAFTQDGWLVELKHDGFRALASKTGTDTRLVSRHGRSFASAFPEVIRALAALPCELVLDAELVVPDVAGRSDFEGLRRRALLTRPQLVDHAAATQQAVLVCFDVLAADGRDLRSLPQYRRRAWLELHLTDRPGLQVIQSVEREGEALFALACDQDQEGIVTKRLDSPYRAGRVSTWLKIKNKGYSRQDAVVWQGRR